MYLCQMEQAHVQSLPVSYTSCGCTCRQSGKTTELKSNSEPKLATRLMSLNESGERRRSVTLEVVVRAE